MKRVKYLLIFLMFVFSGTLLRAQLDMPKYKDVQEFKNRQLIVLVNPPDPNLINKYNRKGKTDIIQEYDQIIGNYNDELKYMVKKYWTFNSKEVLFMNWGEMQQLLADKSNRDKYYVMYGFCIDNHKAFDWNIDKNGERIIGTYSYIGIGFPNDNPFMHIHFVFQKLIPTAKELAYFISAMNFNFNYVLNHGEKSTMKDMVLENAHTLPGKTLLLEQSKVSPTVVNDIGKYYHCNYKVVSDSEMEQAVITGDSTDAYIIISDIGNNVMNLIVSCGNGATLAYTDKGTMGISFTSDQGLRKDFFEDIGADCDEAKKK